MIAKLYSPLILIYILSDPVRNVDIPNPEPEYNPGKTITCQAEGRPSPSFSWVDVKTDQSVNGHELKIEASMERDQEYRCEAENTIHSEVYTNNKTISFVVIGKIIDHLVLAEPHYSNLN